MTSLGPKRSNMESVEEACDRLSRRLESLEPNAAQRSMVVPWCWSFPLQTVTLGTPAKIYVSDQPIVTVRPKKLIMNIASQGMFHLLRFVAGNELVIEGPTDAAVYGRVQGSAASTCTHCGAPAQVLDAVCRYCGTAPILDTKAYGQEVACRTMPPSLKAVFELEYTGRLPPGAAKGETFSLSIALHGVMAARL